MLEPKKLKFRKPHRPHVRGNATRRLTIAFGQYGLKAQTGGWISARQIEAARKAMSHEMKRAGKLWIRIFPDRPITGKGGEVGMGHGKGVITKYVAEVKPGMMLFELDGVTEVTAREALRLAGHKLPIKVKFIKKEN